MPDQESQTNPSDSSSPQEPLTWQRPHDGAPVYGVDPGAPRPEDELPPPPPPPPQQQQPGIAAASAPAPWQYGPPPPPSPPVVGPAVPPSYAPPPPPQVEGGAWQPPPQDQWGWQQQPPPPDYSQPPYPPPDAQVPPPGYGWQHPGTYHQYPPPYGPRPDADAKTRNALVLSICGLTLALCCAPAGIVLGAIGVAMASGARGRAAREGYRDDSANAAFWLGITAIILGVLNFLAGQVMMMLNPHMLEDLMGGFLNR